MAINTRQKPLPQQAIWGWYLRPNGNKYETEPSATGLYETDASVTTAMIWGLNLSVHGLMILSLECLILLSTMTLLKTPLKIWHSTWKRCSLPINDTRHRTVENSIFPGWGGRVISALNISFSSPRIFEFSEKFKFGTFFENRKRKCEM